MNPITFGLVAGLSFLLTSILFYWISLGNVNWITAIGGFTLWMLTSYL